LQNHNETQPGCRRIKAALSLAAAAVLATAAAAPAEAGNGGTGTAVTKLPTGKAKLVRGKAIAPADAPRRVVQVINAANRIRNKPYKWGGGHGRWNDSGYDCSGSVSFALHGGRLLRSPLDSGGFMRWGRGGKGKWITVYTNPGHAFLVVAGLRFDTSQTPGNGPGWSKRLRPKSGFKARHKAGY
jgi:cell wall-associated NlpC family hydrolase